MLFNQMNTYYGPTITSCWWTPDGSDYDEYSWDQFTVNSQCKVTEVWWVGGHGYGLSFTPQRFTVRFFKSIAGGSQPIISALPENETSADYWFGQTFNNSCNETSLGGGFYQYHCTITNPTQFFEPNTVYWMKIVADATTIPDWGFARGGNGNHFRFLTGGPYFQNAPGDCCFKLLGNYSSTTLKGTVTLNGISVPPTGESVQWELRDGGGSVVQSGTTTLNSTGAFAIPLTLVNGTYDLTMQGATHLRAVRPNVEMGGLVQNLNFSLVNGDCTGNNVIDLGDFDVLSGAFGTSFGEAGFAPGADLNRDQVVDLGDFDLLSLGFGESGY